MHLSTILRVKRGFIFKAIIAIPILWFSMIGFMVVLTGEGAANARSDGANWEENQNAKNHQRHQREVTNDPRLTIRREHNVKTQNNGIGTGNFPMQPVIEQPNPDRLLLEERMREEAANLLRQKEQERMEKKHEEDRLRAMNPPVQPLNPFHEHDKPPIVKEKPVVNPNAPGKLSVLLS